MVDLRKVHQRGIAGMQAAYREAQWEYEQAALAEDVDAMAQAATRMAGLEATAEKFNGLANRAMNPQPAAAPVDAYGLTADERQVALNSCGPIKNQKGQMVDLTQEQKLQLYSHNKAKLAHMRATGQYRHTTDQTG